MQRVFLATVAIWFAPWFAAFGAPGVAEPAKGVAVAAESSSLTFMQMFILGGPVMYVLALLSVLVAAMIVFNLATIRRNAIVSDRFMDQAEYMIRARDLQALATYSRGRNESMARITQRVTEFIIANPTVTLAEVREMTESEGSRQAGILTSRVSHLSDIGNIVPMVGLLGTVHGLMKAFDALAHAQVQTAGKQLELSAGISTALIATGGGLLIAIPTLFAYSIFRTRVQRYIGELEAASSHLVALLQALTVRASQSPTKTEGKMTRTDGKAGRTQES